MTQAIFLFSPHASPIQSAARKTKSTVHWIIMACSGVTFLLGISAIMYNKYLRDKPHFTTWHSWFGLTAGVLASVQSSCGVFLFYPNLVPFFTLKQLKMMHAVSGALTFTTSCCAVLLACYSNWFVSQGYPTVVWYLFAIGPVFLVTSVSKQVYSSHFERVRKP